MNFADICSCRGLNMVLGVPKRAFGAGAIFIETIVPRPPTPLCPIQVTWPRWIASEVAFTVTYIVPECKRKNSSEQQLFPC